MLIEYLPSICHGISSSESGREMYSYQSTLKNFLERYESKNDNIQKGMMGELLLHLIIRIYFKEFQVATAFFNLEEKSIKKGFDLVLRTNSDNPLWITEVKSGQLHHNKNSNETSIDLLRKAKTDLENKFKANNDTFWYNATNHAKCVYDKYSDLKDAMTDLLEDAMKVTHYDDSIVSKRMNVFIVSVLFSPLSESITEDTIRSEKENITKENIFNKVFVIASQKETYSRIYNFLKEERDAR